jgi:hypothetical protein
MVGRTMEWRSDFWRLLMGEEEGTQVRSRAVIYSRQNHGVTE